MKHNISTPYWIIISIAIGFLSFALSSYLLFNMTVERIVTIFYSTALYKDLDTIKKELFLKNLLPEINDKASLNLNPALFRWIIFHSVSLSLCLASSIFIFYFMLLTYKEYKRYFNLEIRVVLITFIIVVILALLYIAKPQTRIINGVEIMTYFNINFDNPKCAINIIVWPMYTVSLIPIIGILMGNFATYFAFENKIKTILQSQEEKTKAYSDLKDRLNIFTFYLGLLVSCAVIGSGLQRDMITNQIGKLLYPEEMVYAYGIAFSTILALLFIPSFIYLRYAGKEYQNIIDSTKKEDWWKIGVDTVDNFKLALSVALPLISSIVQPIITGH